MASAARCTCCPVFTGDALQTFILFLIFSSILATLARCERGHPIAGSCLPLALQLGVMFKVNARAPQTSPCRARSVGVQPLLCLANCLLLDPGRDPSNTCVPAECLAL